MEKDLFMNEVPRITILMPSLNVGSYIRECMESVTGQTLQDIEILCIDGGSTDGTLDVLEEYAARDPRVALMHSAVKSYGHQINLGLDAARGEYIGIVETDDYIASEMFQKLYDVAGRTGKPDIVKSGFYNVWSDGKITPEYTITAETGEAFPLTAHEDLIIMGHPSIWSCIYKKSFLDNHGIRMKEVPGGGWVDNLFLYQTMCEAGRIAWVNEPLYYYRQDNAHSSSRLMDCSVPFERINDVKDYLEVRWPDNLRWEKHLLYRMMMYVTQNLDNPNLTSEDKRFILKTLRRFHLRTLARAFTGQQIRKLKQLFSADRPAASEDSAPAPQPSVAAVIVTYNRQELLFRCIEHVLQQEGAACDILVIDNHSTDGTKESLQPFINTGQLDYTDTGENLGGAGGFSFGIRRAAEKGYDRIWVMDDDCMPGKDALAALLRAERDLNGEYGFLSSRVLWKDGSLCDMNLQRETLTRDLKGFDQRLQPVVMASFVSLFLKRETVLELGLPIKEFFIWTDDWEYTRRISRKYPCYAVADSTVLHLSKSNIGADIATESAERLDRFDYLYRNDVCLYRREGLRGFAYEAVRLSGHCLRVLLKAKDHKKERLQKIIGGTRKGLSFRPTIERISEEEKP